mmetsp:Transcript_99270/g.283994  ORF Transcript_99270/g.283994 Transcript_99270/m.283994 type:complete len:114 (-) Transcript_99270:132-473(-)
MDRGNGGEATAVTTGATAMAADGTARAATGAMAATTTVATTATTGDAMDVVTEAVATDLRCDTGTVGLGRGAADSTDTFMAEGGGKKKRKQKGKKQGGSRGGRGRTKPGSKEG